MDNYITPINEFSDDYEENILKKIKILENRIYELEKISNISINDLYNKIENLEIKNNNNNKL